MSVNRDRKYAAAPSAAWEDSMKNRIYKAVAVLLLLLCALLAACNDTDGQGGKTPEAIWFGKDQVLRQTYVQGQELSLSGVLLSCDMGDGKTETVAADSADVTVSGYDQSKLGEQTVTVTYGGKTATFTVTVIPRLAVSGHDVNYFVGDAFNTQKGTVQVADDQGKTTSVALKDASVTVSGFASETAGKKTVTVSVGGYSTTVEVNVLAVEKVTLTKAPSKKTYRSDETEFSVDGGYLTVVSAGSVITKTVPLTADMITGFDPSAATPDHATADTALHQTVKIGYLGFSFDFNITVRYSSVSAVLAAADALDGIDLSRATEEEIGSAAMDALEEYFTLTGSERAKIPAAKRDLLARFASVYAYDRFITAVDAHKATFELEAEQESGSYFGVFSIKLTSTYAGMKQALVAMTGEDSVLLRFGDFLHRVEKEFPSLKIDGDKTTDAYFAKLYLDEDLEMIVSMFTHLTLIHEKLLVVPENWTRESIKDAAQVEAIESAYARIAFGEYKFANYAQLYAMLETWRPKQDSFDILHAHYLYNKTYQNDEDYVGTVWQVIPLPSELQLLYDQISVGIYYSGLLKNSVEDTANFMLIYRAVTQISTDIKAKESLYHDIYREIDFDYLIDGYLYTASLSGDTGIGYVDIMGGLLYRDEVREKLWNDYFAILDLIDENNRLDMTTAEAAAAMDRMFSDYWSVTPYERYLFLCSLYSNYRSLSIRGYVLDTEQGYTSIFTGAIISHYLTAEGVLPEELHGLFNDLLIASEQYGLRYKSLSSSLTAVADFVSRMEAIKMQYEMLAPENRTVFDTYAGKMYQANMALYQALKADTPAIGDHAQLGDMKMALEAYFDLLDLLKKAEQDESVKIDNDVYALLLAAYQYAESTEAKILASGDDALITAYRTYVYMTLNENDANKNNDYEQPLESIMDQIRENANTYTLVLTDKDGNKTSHSAIAYYTEHGLAPFFENCFPILYADYLDEKVTDFVPLVDAFRELDADALSVLRGFGLDARYFSTLERCYHLVLDDENSAERKLVDAMLAAEKAYADCRADEDAASAEHIEAFKTAWAAVEAAHAELGAETEIYRLILMDYYIYLLDAYNGMEA